MIKEIIILLKEVHEMYQNGDIKVVNKNHNIQILRDELPTLINWADKTHPEKDEELYKELINNTRELLNRLDGFFEITTDAAQFRKGKALEESRDKINKTLQKTQTFNWDLSSIKGNDFDVDKLGQNKVDVFDYKSAYNELSMVATSFISCHYTHPFNVEEREEKFKWLESIVTRNLKNKEGIDIKDVAKLHQNPLTPNECIKEKPTEKPKEEWLVQLLKETKEIMEAMQTRMLLIEAEYKRKK